MKREEYLNAGPEVTDWDINIFKDLIRVELTEDERSVIHNPSIILEHETSVLAIHWHPENIPLDDCAIRIQKTFPALHHSLIIPTQHNQLMKYGEYLGVEIDCLSSDFNRKIQLLAHFSTDREPELDIFKSMLEHTVEYRQKQLEYFIDVIINPRYEEHFKSALVKIGGEQELADFVKRYTSKLHKMILEMQNSITPIMIKNKLLTNYFVKLKHYYDKLTVNRALALLKELKANVKQSFSKDYFYDTYEVIEEIRGAGGGIIVPHPEQFWPILLSDYDVDGYEVWNPQSREFTEFLIRVVSSKNRSLKPGNRKLLISMGDDTHLGEKIKPYDECDPEKASREIGYQPPWEEMLIKKALMLGKSDKNILINEYKERLN